MSKFRFSKHPYPKIALDFWTGPMDVFLSWLRLNVMPEELYTKEQIDALIKRRGRYMVHQWEEDEPLVDWLNRVVAPSCPSWKWVGMQVTLGLDPDSEDSWGSVGKKFVGVDLTEEDGP